MPGEVKKYDLYMMRHYKYCELDEHVRFEQGVPQEKLLETLQDFLDDPRFDRDKMSVQVYEFTEGVTHLTRQREA